MEFSQKDKNVLLKAFMDILKDANGKGPKDIYIKFFLDEIHIIIQGVISDFERYLIKQFGQEAIDILKNFYERDSYNTEKVFLKNINYKFDLRFYELESDFINDHFIYKMRLHLEEAPSS